MLKHELSFLGETHKKLTFWYPAERVCMFQNPLPVMEKETLTFKHTRSIFIQNLNNTPLKRFFIMYVCLKTFWMSEKTKHTRSNMKLRTKNEL